MYARSPCFSRFTGMEPQEGSNKGSLQSEPDLSRDLAPPLGEKRWKVWSQSQSAWIVDQRVQVTEHVRYDSQHPIRRKKLAHLDSRPGCRVRGLHNAFFILS